MDEVGCLCIGELTVGKSGFSGPFPFQRLEGVALFPFTPGAGDVWEELQAALQAVRAQYGGACILAAGAGCAAGLALSAQLPVDRLALVWPRRPMGSLRRMERFARRNLPLCVCDILAVEREGEDGLGAMHAMSLGRHSRLIRLSICGESGLNLFANCKNELDMVLSCFLRTGELPKSLAENREMCIIYG